MVKPEFVVTLETKNTGESGPQQKLIKTGF